MFFNIFAIIKFKTSQCFHQVETSLLPEIDSTQEETDTRVVLYLHQAAAWGYENAVVRTPDTDIFMILLMHAHGINLTIFIDTGTGKNRRLINISELAESFGEHYCSALLGLHVFSGEDCTSAIKGNGTVTPQRKLEKIQDSSTPSVNWVIRSMCSLSTPLPGYPNRL